MWTFAGLALIAWVLYHWLRRIHHAMKLSTMMWEAFLNRTAKRTGDAPIMADTDPEHWGMNR